ncbi:unnamed protein product [Ilex paraguariensis]|uniref:Uncharacterized protein n=1 Tax=Ilex paraguariensis TaxID=185542 RepID=A0ABC8SU29_9AQUA
MENMAEQLPGVFSGYGTILAFGNGESNDLAVVRASWPLVGPVFVPVRPVSVNQCVSCKDSVSSEQTNCHLGGSSLVLGGGYGRLKVLGGGGGPNWGKSFGESWVVGIVWQQV